LKCAQALYHQCLPSFLNLGSDGISSDLTIYYKHC